MDFSTLTAIGPLDGRYRSKVEPLASYFSEWALIKYRLKIEVEYLIALYQTGISPLQPLESTEITFLRSIYENFSEADGWRVKEIERTTNHDVKAVEYLIKEKIDASGHQRLIDQKEFVHFGLTSQDINNTATPLLLKDAIEEEYIPRLESLISQLKAFAAEWKHIPLLARTHGQPASPTTLGKEIAVFVARFQKQLEELKSLPYPAKFGGATGNLNAHYLTYSEYNWKTFAENLMAHLGLERSWPTTQIEHYDGLARIFDCLRRINTICIDLCQDMWLYISIEYFRQKTKAGEIGSSAMPHKVNPIDFENGEGNCGLSTALLEFLSRKLPVSRWQRDLTDSTVLRNLGMALGYACLAQGSIQKGLGKLLVNKAAIAADLDANWAVLAEAIQNILRREGYPKPYETLLELTRGKSGINAESLKVFVEGLNIREEVKAELLQLRPEMYIGDAGI